jgi:hypothetical protein
MTNQISIPLDSNNITQVVDAPPSNQTIQSAPTQATQQYLRKVSLVVSNAFGTLDLSQMRIKFRVYQAAGSEFPAYADIRVLNLSDATATQVQQQYTDVTLSAGYEGGAFGLIFQGTIKQVRRGREDQTNKYLEIRAADGDVPRQFGVVNTSLAAGATQPSNIVKTITGQIGVPQGYTVDVPQGVAQSRGKVMFGMATNDLDTVGSSNGMGWWIDKGKLNMVPLDSYIPREAIVLTSNTGMVGLPEQTEDGIHVRCLLNPNIRIGTLVQINNTSVQRELLGGQNLFATGRLENIPGLLPKVTDDGFYMVYVAEYVGDTRGHGQDWLTELTCLAIIPAAPVSDSVSTDG